MDDNRMTVKKAVTAKPLPAPAISQKQGDPLGMIASAPAPADKPVQGPAEELDEHVLWMDPTTGAVFMTVAPVYCGEVSGVEHAWDMLRSQLQRNRR